MASAPVGGDAADRDRDAHITNGSNSKTEKRDLLNNIPELAARGLQDKVETFLASTFGMHLLPDMLGRVKYYASQEPNAGANSIVRKFSVDVIEHQYCYGSKCENQGSCWF